MEYLEVALDALLDTAKLILPLLLVYMLIEFVEERRQAAFIKKIGVENKIAPLWGSLFGCIPQCGFSGIAAELFSHKFIVVGTLIAVFLATADEALPVLFSHLAAVTTRGIKKDFYVAYCSSPPFTRRRSRFSCLS